MSLISLTIDGRPVEVQDGATVFEAARAAGIYIPALCAHPELPPGGECGLCTVELGGEVVRACEVKAAGGQSIVTASDCLSAIRRDNLSVILKNHPHACLTCAQKVGCSRTQCSGNVAVNERCCSQLGNCEIERIVEYIGLREDLGRYMYGDLPKYTGEPLFTRDYNLCIGCQRCVRVCRDVRGVNALEVYERDGRTLVRAKAGSLAESGCKFCTACVEVCPTGSLVDKDFKSGDRGANIVPCRNGCPAGIDVPRYLGYVASEQYTGALAVIREKVPFPGSLGRVCFHPCEDVCRRGQVNEPVAICRLTRYAADNGGKAWKGKRRAKPATGERVAVIGSGPAGLTAANYLALKGHGVTVFEALAQPGGMLRFGIPAYRLPKNVLDQEIAEIRDLGVEIQTNTKVESLDELFNQGYQAVFVGVGAHKAVALGVPGEDNPGVVDGISFLRAIAFRKIDGIGKRVAVIGGGNVAMDAARSAIRLGAGEVTVIYRRSAAEMPAFAEEVAEAAHEGIKFAFLTEPTQITTVRTLSGSEFKLGLTGKKSASTLVLECRRMALDEAGAGGRRRPVPVDGSAFTMEFDNIITALGQQPDVPGGFGLELDKGVIRVDQDDLRTGRAGVYAGGDVVLGPASVIEAIAHGRQAAASIDRFLGGDGDIAETLCEWQEPDPWLGPGEDFASARRAGETKRPWQKSLAKTSGGGGCPSDELLYTAFTEVDIGLFEEMAGEEAGRCLNCHLRLQLISK